MLAVGLDTLLFLFLVGMAGLLKLLASKTSVTPDDSEDSPPGPGPRPPAMPNPRASVETDADRMRKFLEALGQPPQSRPPPPVRPRAAPPPLPEVYAEQPQRRIQADWKRGIWNPLPPVKTVPPPLERPRRVTQPRQKAQPSLPTEIPPTVVAAAPVFEERAQIPSSSPQIEPLTEAYTIDAPARTKGKSTTSDLVSLLRSPGGLRQAMILREVFGPPRSLQPFDLVGSA